MGPQDEFAGVSLGNPLIPGKSPCPTPPDAVSFEASGGKRGGEMDVGLSVSSLDFTSGLAEYLRGGHVFWAYALLPPTSAPPPLPTSFLPFTGCATPPHISLA